MLQFSMEITWKFIFYRLRNNCSANWNCDKKYRKNLKKNIFNVSSDTRSSFLQISLKYTRASDERKHIFTWADSDKFFRDLLYLLTRVFWYPHPVSCPETLRGSGESILRICAAKSGSSFPSFDFSSAIVDILTQNSIKNRICSHLLHLKDFFWWKLLEESLFTFLIVEFSLWDCDQYLGRPSKTKNMFLSGRALITRLTKDLVDQSTNLLTEIVSTSWKKYIFFNYHTKMFTCSRGSGDRNVGKCLWAKLKLFIFWDHRQRQLVH